jgi:hypothetical protein
MMAEGTYNQIKHLFFRGVNIAQTPKRVHVKGYPEPVSTYGIYVNNLSILKDKSNDDPDKPFYIYQKVNHNLKFNESELKEIKLTQVSKYL